MPDEINNCYFCGNKAVLAPRKQAVQHWVICDSPLCRAIGPTCDDGSHAIEVWNSAKDRMRVDND